MAWKGFITESKLYMNYPGRIKGYREGIRWDDFSLSEEHRAIRFWLRFPRAWFGFFVLLPLRDWWARKRNGNA